MNRLRSTAQCSVTARGGAINKAVSHWHPHGDVSCLCEESCCNEYRAGQRTLVAVKYSCTVYSPTSASFVDPVSEQRSFADLLFKHGKVTSAALDIYCLVRLA